MGLISSLNNATTADAFADAATLRCYGARKENVTVTGAAVYYSLAEAGLEGVDTSRNFGPEVFLPPGRYGWTRPLHGMRFRSAKAGTPAQVTAEAFDA